MVEHGLDDPRVAVFRQRLMDAVVVVVVVVEAHRQALQHLGRQLGRIAAPLLDRVATKEGFVEIAADELQGLLFEIRGLVDAVFGQPGDEVARLLRTEVGAEELVDRMQVDRQAEYAARRPCLDAIDERHPFAEALQVRPDAVVAGVEDMRPVDMRHDPGGAVPRGVAMAADVGALLDDMYVDAGLGQLARQHRAGKSRADDQDRAHAIASVRRSMRSCRRM